jgi:hypothetical protein
LQLQQETQDSRTKDYSHGSQNGGNDRKDCNCSKKRKIVVQKIIPMEAKTAVVTAAQGELGKQGIRT